MQADLNRRLALSAAGAAVIAAGFLTAGCAGTTKEAPSTGVPSVSGTQSATVSPTEKNVAPVMPGGPNSFTPTMNPKPPGPTCTAVVGNNCVR